MDADDRMAPQKLELMQTSLAQKGKGYLAIGLVEYFSEHGIGDGYRRYAAWLNDLTRHEKNFEDRYKECVIPSPCWMCHREDLIYCGAFNSDRYPEDYDLAFRFYQGGLKILGIPEVLHHWRDYSSRSSRTSEHYSDNRFLDLKVDYFLKLDFQQERPLVIWGAGKKGKRLAQLLIDKGKNFHWITNNKAKIGHVIYGQKVEAIELFSKLIKPQIILAVASPKDQLEIALFLKNSAGIKKENCFWFC